MSFFYNELHELNELGSREETTDLTDLTDLKKKKITSDYTDYNHGEISFKQRIARILRIGKPERNQVLNPYKQRIARIKRIGYALEDNSISFNSCNSLFN